jgi:hypothetical protein
VEERVSAFLDEQLKRVILRHTLILQLTDDGKYSNYVGVRKNEKWSRHRRQKREKRKKKGKKEKEEGKEERKKDSC